MAPLQPEGASAMQYRDGDHAADLARSQGIGARELDGYVDAVATSLAEAGGRRRARPVGARDDHGDRVARRTRRKVRLPRPLTPRYRSYVVDCSCAQRRSRGKTSRKYCPLARV